MLTQERLKELLDYDPETGVFTWKVVTSNRIRIGDQAGAASGDGYIHIRVGNKQYKAHRLAWLYMYGRWPRIQIDHINRVKKDNSIDNLREATHQENQFNSEAKGYYWDTKRKKWHAQIMFNRKQKYLGRYDTEEEAKTAYLKTKEKIHKIGEHHE